MASKLLSAEASRLCRFWPVNARTSTRRQPGILVVDDEEFVRRLLEISLPRLGFCGYLAAGGHDALAVYQLHRKAIDAVLMDVRMPGLDGPQTLAALRQLNPALPCCFMSGHCGNYHEEQLAVLGDGYLPKPFQLTDVSAALRRLVGVEKLAFPTTA